MIAIRIPLTALKHLCFLVVLLLVLLLSVIFGWKD